VSDYPKGLRFDIYERITLPEEVVGIGELEDIELLPRITMQTHEDQAVLSGDLMLVGTYVGVEPDSGIKQLRHRIPVEITLPLRRIRRMDNIGIEIENFDVELLSARTLNITGVISLTGVDTTYEPASQQAAWREQGEAWFVHEAAKPAGQEEQGAGLSEATQVSHVQAYNEATVNGAASYEEPVFAYGAQPESAGASRDAIGQAGSAYELRSSAGDHSSAEDRVEPQPATQQEPVPAPQAKEQPADGKKAEALEAVVKEEADKAIAAAAEEQVGKSAAAGAKDAADHLAAVEANENAPKETAGAADNVSKSQALEAVDNAVKPDTSQAENEQAESLQAKSETQEMKIAFGSNKQDSSGWAGAVAGVKSLLQHVVGKSVQSAEEQEAEPAAEENKQAKRGEDQIQWKNLLLSSEHEEQRFRRVRMCIVQKEETLDTIASRYSLNPKEIVLYNRLESDRVYEGQVIYIPK